ncbi:MAG: EAL domain-containing protein [Betaproteobacteria bacterium]|nr:EAL domain-containing protein [Betaproteobacteria bacterium]
MAAPPMDPARPADPGARGLAARVLLNVAVALAYLALAAFPAAWFPGASPLWPPAALAAFAALRWGAAAMPGVFLASLMANALASRLGLGPALLASAGNALAPLLGRAVLRRLGGSAQSWWESPRSVLAFLLSMGLLQSLAAALIGVGAMAWLGSLQGPAVDIIVDWAIADASAVVMLTPLLQLGLRGRAAPRPPLSARRALRIAGLFALVLLIWALAAGGTLLANAQRTGLLGLLLFPLIGSVFALDALVTAGLLAFSFCLLTGSAALGVPIVEAASSAQTIVGLEFFLLAVGGAVLFASSLQHAHRATLQRLQAQTSQLDALTREQARHLDEQQDQFRGQLRRFSELAGILSTIGQVIERAHDDVELLQKFCELMIGLQGVTLAWIGRPDDAGRFRVVAKAGPAQAYLDGIRIDLDTASPYGRGPAARAWRSGKPAYVQDARGDPAQVPWAQRMQAFGLYGNSSVPLLRGGRPWANFNLYLNVPGGFDPLLQKVAEQIAADISIGLDRLDAVRREREQSRVNVALLSNMTVGVNVVRYPERLVEHANARLLQMLGTADLAQLQARPAAEFYADAAEAERVARMAREILHSGRGSLQGVRHLHVDGHTVITDLSGVRLDLGDGAQRILWTQIDVSERHQQARELRQTQGVYRALAAASDSLLQGATEAGMIARLCQSLVDGTEFSAAWLVRPDEHEHMAVLAKAGEQARDIAWIDTQRPRLDDPQAAAARAWHAQASVTQEQAPGEPAQAWAALLALPVRRGGQLWGVLTLAARTPGIFDATTRGACEQVAALLGHGLDELDRKNTLQLLQDTESRRARTDALTGLPNRLALDEFLPGAIARAERRGSLLAVGMLDLDNFKPVNDRYGHAVGDVLLQKLARALRLRLRGGDFLARLGGDEFVIVSEDLDPLHALQDLAAALDRLHAAVEAPFDLGEGRSAQVGMTMGLALCPSDAREPDGLLRMADAAMYACKTHKHDRSSWWRVGTAEVERDPDFSREAPVDAFGAESRTLLAALDEQLLRTAAADFGTTFYDTLARDEELAAILRCLSAEELERLKRSQGEHLLLLLGPGTTRAMLEAKAAQLGQVHALIGVSGARMEEAFALYEDLLRTQLENALISSRQRYRVLRVATSRLRLDVQIQLSAIDQTTSRYFAQLHPPLRERTRWVDVLPETLQALAELPGVLGAVVFRPDEHGVLREEAAAGAHSQRLVSALREKSLYPNLNPRPGLERGPLAKAWFMRDFQVVDAYLLDQRLLPWHGLAREFGWRSAATVPIAHGDNTDSVLMLFGAYPHQFSSSWARSWLGLLRARIDAQFAATARNHQPVDPEMVRHFRELLYGDGLRMWVQPIVDLHSGAVTKVEALARLRGADGSVYNPGQFLAAFGEQELHALFRQGMAQTLEHLHAWREAGLDLELSLNLPPQTLLHEQCAAWIEEALRRAGVAATHLSLEVLESDGLDVSRSDEAIHAIGRLGVRLVLDDLGSGYSSITRLASLPVDTVKIDQGLIRQLPRDPVRTIRLLAALVRIGQEFAPHTVIEGLQDDSFVEVARQLGARLGQGFALSRPMPAEDFLAWSRERGAGGEDAEAPLRTWPGALACLWMGARDPQRARRSQLSPAGAVDCPLGRFLRAQRVTDPRVLAWYEDFLGADGQRTERATEELLQWMAQRVMLEGAQPPARA